MKITWLGHAGFRIEIAGQVLLVDPWLTGNPVFPTEQSAAAIAGATAVLVTHGHGDHASGGIAIAKETGAPIHALHELAEYAERQGAPAMGFGKGGTVHVGDVALSLVPASHSSSIDWLGGDPIYAGAECGFMIAGEGHTIYLSGDTGIMADMAWMGEYFAPDIGIICAGGHYTMGPKEVAWIARKYFDFKVLIPCHWKTFGLLAQSMDGLKADLPEIDVKIPEVLVPITI